MPTKCCGRCTHGDYSAAIGSFFLCDIHEGKAVTFITPACVSFSPSIIFDKLKEAGY